MHYLIKKWTKDLSRHFTNGDIHVKRCSMSLVIWEIQIKTMRYCTPTKMAIIKTTNSQVLVSM